MSRAPTEERPVGLFPTSDFLYLFRASYQGVLAELTSEAK
ncbi:hypothetical protein HMPREF0083_03836 [Aneurinibacillus aneurinilyticus ATCC 12856]|uniref:Uncharacterized protein n=1 Tax=Aneurinibacillus aneurinilyticus ATCC 12856 TaxID=649747 RepID=U1Y7G0_ANEAE|nr:hypothetical protein HMPREF0083_03836 [Aneurinibacillus aneurinilyticus ATCC 12856]